MYRRVLVPLDGSVLAERALPHAVAHAEYRGAELILLKVQAPLGQRVGGVSSAMREARKHTDRMARDYLARVAEQIQARELAVKTAIVEGWPHIEIPRFAEENDVDLIVLSTQGRPGLTGWLRSSVAQRVMRGSKVPIVVVQSRAN